MARAYGQISGSFWQRGSGKALRGDAYAQALAPYLFCGPHSNMVGLYVLGVPVMAHELGWTVEAVSAALAALVRAGIVKYDADAELVWLPRGFKYQTGQDSLKTRDKKRAAVIRELSSVGDHPFAGEFRSIYMNDHTKPVCPFDAPSGVGGMGHTHEPDAPVSSPAPVPVPVPVPVPDGGSGGAPPPIDAPPGPDTPEPRASAVADVLAADRYACDIDHDLVAWATVAVGAMGVRMAETTPEQCADAVRARLSQLGSEMSLADRRRTITNALRYLPDNLRKQRDKARSEEPATAQYGERGRAERPKPKRDIVPLTPERMATLARAVANVGMPSDGGAT